MLSCTVIGPTVRALTSGNLSSKACRLDGPNGRQIERIAEADTREELETKYKRRLDSYYGIYHNRQLVKP
jgi:hypothetical protein